MGALTAPRLWLSRITSSTLIAVALIFAAFDIVFAFDLVVSPLVSVGELLLLVLWARLGIRPSAKSTQSRKARALALGIAALTLLCFVQKGYHLGRFLAGVSALQDAQFYENFTVLTLFFAMVLGVVRGQKLRRFLEAVERNPARLSAVTFGLFIFFGGVLLSHPLSLRGSDGSKLLDGVFTATSAVCLTGLCPFNVPATYSGFGQLVMLLLIQAGGLGYVILGSALALVAGKRLDSRSAIALAETVDSRSLGQLKDSVRFVIVATFVLELCGALALYLATLSSAEVALGPESTHPAAGAGSRAWWALFHSISAFCNCGFSLSNSNLMAYSESAAVSGIVAALIAVGGIGFPVLAELWRRVLAARQHERAARLSLHLRVVLASTGLLIVLPALLLLVLEWSASFAELSVEGKLVAAVFHSISMRTGGFNTVDVGKFGAAAMWLTSLVMLIGAGPVSTAGGVRVTSAAAAWAFLRAEVRGRRASLFDRVLPDATVRRALAVILVSTLFVLAMTALLLSEERYAPLAALFEVCSAFATCGLSSGVTAQLSSFGKVVLIVTMLIGRVGPLTFVLALFVARGPRRAELAEERVLLG